ncbi:MAG: aspartate ammonia-lyase [Candidatus Taylorbacteria bacterium]
MTNRKIRQKKYYGKETGRAISNFPFDYPRVHSEFIYAIVKIKKAAAFANSRTGDLAEEIKNSIDRACDEILDGKFDEQFLLPGIQGGAGTSVNMNVNEVIANRATEILENVGGKNVVHPNDHVNRSQSTNDVNPSALKLACFDLLEALERSVSLLFTALENKSREFRDVLKLGRTHLQDALPTTLGAEFLSFAFILKRHHERIGRVKKYCLELNLGGTAIGNSINASPEYIAFIFLELRRMTNRQFYPAKSFMSQTSSQTDFLAISQAVSALMLDSSKIADDLRLMAGGPSGGFAEIELPELQKGSSIMPGKVNPVVPETVNQAYYLISGNTVSVEGACAGAQLELGVMLPVIVDRLIQSLKLANEVLTQFSGKCIAGIRANKEICRKYLENSTAYATLLSPKIGYDATTALVRESRETGKNIRELAIHKKILTENEFDKLVRNSSKKSAKTK